MPRVISCLLEQKNSGTQVLIIDRGKIWHFGAQKSHICSQLSKSCKGFATRWRKSLHKLLILSSLDKYNMLFWANLKSSYGNNKQLSCLTSGDSRLTSAQHTHTLHFPLSSCHRQYSESDLKRVFIVLRNRTKTLCQSLHLLSERNNNIINANLPPPRFAPIALFSLEQIFLRGALSFGFGLHMEGDLSLCIFKCVCF